MSVLPSAFYAGLMVTLVALGAALTSPSSKGSAPSDPAADGLSFMALPIHLLDLRKKTNGEYFSWDLCDCEVTSNLGGQGPDSQSPSELRFGTIGYYDGYPVDLVFTNTSAYSAADVYRNTARGCFGVINVMADTAADLAYTFVKGGTNEPMIINKTFYFSLFDLDCSASGCEVAEVDGMADYDLDDATELVVSQGSKGLQFKGSTFGIGADNPPPLEALQKARSVTFVAVGISGGTLSYTVENSKKGRNFLIAGKSFLTKETTTTTTLMGSSKSCTNCIIWGDPHVITFDASAKRVAQHPLREAFFRTRGWKSDQVSIYDEGTFWLVKSKNVHIQGRYWHNKTHVDWTNLGALAVGGPFLNGNTLTIRPLGSPSTWNGQEILAIMPSHFENEYVQAKFHHNSEIIKNGDLGEGIDVELPDDVRLTVNRWKQNLAVKISMCPQAGGQDGQCGNYNGVASDDVENVMIDPSALRVPEHEFLFQTPVLTQPF